MSFLLPKAVQSFYNKERNSIKILLNLFINLNLKRNLQSVKLSIFNMYTFSKDIINT